MKNLRSSPIRLISFFLVFCLTAGGVYAELTRIGAAGAVRGSVKATAPEPQAVGRVLESGKAIFLNDHVITDAQGKLQVMLLDETVFSLGPNSDMVLDEFVYDPNSGAGKVTASVTKGIFRLVTGKVAAKKPENMAVKLPTGTMGIRGTIAFGIVGPAQTVVGLVGPGPKTNGVDRPGAVVVSWKGDPVTIERPGDVTVFSDKQPPSPPAPATPEIKNQVNSSVGTSAPKSDQASGTAGTAGGATPAGGGTESGSVSKQGGQETQTAQGSLVETQSTTQLSTTLTNTGTNAQQTVTSAVPVVSNIPNWEDITRDIPSGTAYYSSSGLFTQTAGSCGQSCTGSWNYFVNVNFGAKTMTPGYNLSAGFISDSGESNIPFGSLTGPSKFNVSGFNSTANFNFQNANGKTANQLVGTATYSDFSGNKGSGVPLTSTCSGCP